MLYLRSFNRLILISLIILLQSVAILSVGTSSAQASFVYSYTGNNYTDISIFPLDRDDGKLVTSNVPESCVRNGILICYQYYQVMQATPISVTKRISRTKSSNSNMELKYQVYLFDEDFL